MNTIRTRAYAYIRVASSLEKVPFTSALIQIRELRSYAKKYSINVLNGFIDYGVTGLSKNPRQFKEMMAKACDSEHPVDAILIANISRISRNCDICLQAFRKLAANNVKLIHCKPEVATSGAKRDGRSQCKVAR